MKLETPFRMVAAAGLALVVWASGCNTRTPIGEVPDAGQGNDTSLGDGVVGGGSGGAPGGRTGAGGALAGTGGVPAQGGATGAPGGNTGAGGAVAGQAGAGGNTAIGGAPGTMVCHSYSGPTGGAAGFAGDPCGPPLTYPASGFYGDNILAADCTTFTSYVDYELDVMGPSTSTVQVTFTLLSLTSTRMAPYSEPGWVISAEGDWRVKAFDTQTQQQLFQSRPLSENESAIRFLGTGSARVDIHDCDPSLPTRSKIISWVEPPP